MSSGTGTLQYPLSSMKEDIHVTGRRVLATFIDAVILGTAYNFLVALFGGFDHPRPWEWNGVLENVPANILYGIGVVAYFVLMEAYRGQTIGKMVTGVIVVREDRSDPPGLEAAVIRTVLRIVDGLLGYAVAYIVVLSSQKRQRLGDMAARTLVVRRSG
jgi:uncharacterized RDD family membrane protein YckC